MSQVSVMLLLIAPITCHRLIVAPQVDNEWNSVIVSSDPIKITEGTKSGSLNDTSAEREPDHSIRFHYNGIGHPEGRNAKSCKYNDIICLQGTQAPKIESEENNGDIIERFLERYSSITNARFGTDGVNRTDPAEKSYWGTAESEKHENPFNDKKGWVTLDTIPWSTSMVSKWQPNVNPTHPSPSNFDSNLSTQHHYPSDSQPWHYGGVTEKPSMLMWSQQSTKRPPPAPVTTKYGSYTPVSSHHPQSKPSLHWGLGNNDIITDSRPNNFPPENNGYKLPHNQVPNQHRPQDHFPLQQESHSSTTHQVSRPTRPPSSHPSTYPESGNGEWILLSTTKGYSLPNGYRGLGKAVTTRAEGDGFTDELKHGKRLELSKYHEEDIANELPLKMVNLSRKFDNFSNGNRNGSKNWDAKGLRVLHTENGSSIYAARRNGMRHGRHEWNMEESPLQILYSSTEDEERRPEMTLKRAVRFQVLPPVGDTTSLAHNGLIEVDSKFESPEEQHKVMEEEKIKQLHKMAKVRKGNFTLYRVIPTPLQGMSGKSFKDKSTAVLAAVGAGMIPATMAVLVPMALGRKKRSLRTSTGTGVRTPLYGKISYNLT